MSLPSIPAIVVQVPRIEGEALLVEAMRRDLPLAVEFVHQKAHEADENGGQVDWVQDPNSPVGKQLIRMCASDALRPLAVKHFCHDKELVFLNCCGGKIVKGGTKPTLAELIDLQIKMQDGTIARADC